MSQENPTAAALHEALDIVRELRHHLVWQQGQGWGGVPTGTPDNWQPQALSKLLTPLHNLRVPKASVGRGTQRPGHGQVSAGQAGPASSREDVIARMRDFGKTPSPAVPEASSQTTQTNVVQAQKPALPALLPDGPIVIGRVPPRQHFSPQQALSLEQEGRLFERLEKIRDDIGDCDRCSLSKTRQKIVFGAGPSRTRLMLIAPQPNAAEDASGTPFTGDSGKLLKSMLTAIGVPSEEVYIAYQNKCATPNDAPPTMDHIRECFPYLIQQIRAIQPELVLAMGAAVAQAILQTPKRLELLRGSWYALHESAVLPNAKRPCNMLVTYHPFYLLKRPIRKQGAWQDLLMLRQALQSMAQGENA